MSIFDILFAPFLVFIKQLFLFSYNLTGNYGVAILLLSFSVSALLLPVFVFIEKAKKKDNAIKLEMKPVADEIKRCYKGQERHYYLKTLNRQHGYKPLHALIPILSLLLQIPFFIAAYQFLEAYEPLIGVKFGFISDLSKPDALFGAVNFLPIAMTLVNLLTAWFYTRYGEKSERRQMLVVAAVFLVLLFKLPSGLVLYWTMNNVFSFFRLFVTNPEVFRKVSQERENRKWFTAFNVEVKQILPELKILSYFLIIIIVLVQIKWGLNNNFNDITLRIIGAVLAGAGISYLLGCSYLLIKKLEKQIEIFRIKPQFFFTLLFVSVYYFLSGVMYYKADQPGLINISFIAVLFLQLITAVYVVKSIMHGIKLLQGFLLVIISIVLFVQVLYAAMYGISEFNEISILNLNLVLAQPGLREVVLFGILFNVIGILFYVQIEKVDVPVHTKPMFLLFTLAVVYLVGFVVLWNPLKVFSSFPESFTFYAVDILKNNSLLFLKLTISLAVLFLLTPKRLKIFLTITLLTVVFVVFFHGLIFPVQLGSLHEWRFEAPENLNISIAFYLLEGILIPAVVVFVIWLLKNKYYKQVTVGLIALIAVVMFQGLYEAIRSGEFRYIEGKELETKNTLSFSKTEPNVIYLIPDAFQGWNLNKMMKENKDLINEFEGFTWYPNTIAISRVTNTSIGPLIAGYDYVPDKLHADKTRSNTEKITEAKQEMSDRARNNGFLFTSNHLPYTNLGSEAYDRFIPAWHDDWDIFFDELGIDVELESSYRMLILNSLFFSSPLTFKARIYQDGNWGGQLSSNKNSITAEYAKYHFFRILPQISNTKSPQGNFMLVYSQVTHAPTHLVKADGSIERDVSPYRNTVWLMHELRDWINWMKANDVYDNTKIIIVSDHGGHWKHYKGEIDIDIPFYNIDEELIEIEHMLDLNPLLLVKDFNSNEDFNIDWRFMSNVDVPDIAFGDSELLKMDSLDFPERKLHGFTSWWSKDMAAKNDFYLIDEYEVTNNIFDGKNWRLVKQY